MDDAGVGSVFPIRDSSTISGPPRKYLTTVVHTTSSERKLLLDGSPITKFLNVDPSREVSVFGAIWINVPPHRYVEAVKDIENFERGETFKITKRISAPPKVDDFADWQLPKEDFTDLRTCRVGKCELKLSRQTIEKLRAEVDWTNFPDEYRTIFETSRVCLRHFHSMT
jgi:hypothetical protein